MSETQQNPTKTLPEIRLRAPENEPIMVCFAFLCDLTLVETELEKRLRAIPGGWRDIKMIGKVLSNLMAKVMATIPPQKRLAIRDHARAMTYKVVVDGYKLDSAHEDVQVVHEDDLISLVSAAHHYACFACDKRCSECDVGKALDHLAAVSRPKGARWADFDWDVQEFGTPGLGGNG